MPGKKPSRKGEMRRRWRAMMDDGSLAALRSEGRLAALYVLYAADWSSCHVRLSMRRAAKSLGVHTTTVRRGIAQMISGGLLEVLEPGEGGGRTLYVVSERARAVRAPDTSRARSRAPAVRAPDTGGARPGHEPCAQFILIHWFFSQNQWRYQSGYAWSRCYTGPGEPTRFR